MRMFCLLLCLVMSMGCRAQSDDVCEKQAVLTNSFWDNCFGQLGVDMTLVNAYGQNFADVFPNGKSFGVDVAVGKWFTPEYGFRVKLNWENGIVKNDHATWLKDAKSKGFVSLSGDLLINLHNLFGDNDSNRKWNLSVFPRMGAIMTLNNKVGSPIIGVGLSNTYRLNDKWSLYADVAYQGVSSVLGYQSDQGTSSNGFFDINVGVQLDLGCNHFSKATEKPVRNQDAVVLNSFWDNWFVQAGLGMSLLNPYGANFSHVFPNGNTWGINLGVGKWFVPEMGVRVGVNWQNGIIGNNHLSWMDPADNPGANHDAGGWGAAYLDVFFNAHHIFGEYDEGRLWNAIVFPRVGLNSNFEAGSASPMLGLGTEQTFRLSDRMKLFADVAYQVTTSELMGKNSLTTHSNGNSNGWFDFNIGIQYELGQTIGWNKPGEKPSAQMVGGHNWPRFIVNTIASVGVAYVGKTALKAMIKEERPDHSDNKSFPSGHAVMAFAAARSIDKEFRQESIWIPIAGYAAATAIGVERVASDRHHWYDVAAGAALGYGAAELTWWLSDKMFGKGSNIAVGASGNTVDVVYNF